MYQRILVTTDGSELSNKAARSATELAAAIGAELVALHVVRRFPASYIEGGITNLSVTEVSRIEQQWNEHARELVDAVRDAALAAGVKAKSAIGHSDHVADAIVAAARKHECDLIVMASHGRRGLQRVLLGSETQHVLTHSTIPVLVLR